MIVDLAKDAGTDVIVVGNRGQSPLTKFLLGSVASRLVQTAPCPLLMVPSRQQPETSTVAAEVTPGFVRSRA
jgi:nucleotide-binding universal stress UspA family protein